MHYPQNFLCYESGQQVPRQQVPLQPHFQAAPHVPRPQQEQPKSVCRYWAKDGRCPVKRCPFAASHTAQNSPRYAKFVPQAQEPPTSRPNALVIEEPAPTRRSNALLIKDPTEDKATAHRSAALEIKDAPSTSARDDRTPSPPSSRLG